MTTPDLARWSSRVTLLTSDHASEPPGLCAWDDRIGYALYRKGNDTMRWGRFELRPGQDPAFTWRSGQAVGKTQGRPAVVRMGDELHGFYQSGSNDDLWTSRWRAADAPPGPPPPGANNVGGALGQLSMGGPWSERKLDFDTKGPPAVIAIAGGLLLVMPGDHTAYWSKFSGGGFSLPKPITGISLRDDRIVPALAAQDGAVHMMAAVRNHRSGGERALEIFMPGLGTALTSEVEKLSPHWRWDGASWTSVASGFTALIAPSPVGLATLGGRLHLVFRHTDGAVSWYFTDGGQWKHGGQVGTSDQEPSLVAIGDHLAMFTTLGGHLVMRSYHDDVSLRERVAPVRRPPTR